MSMDIFIDGDFSTNRWGLSPTFPLLKTTVVFLGLFFSALIIIKAQQKDLSKEDWWVSPEFYGLMPKVIAVVPMVNMSLEPGVSDILQSEVYKRLQSKGYQKIDAERVGEVMKKLGIQTSEQLAGISYSRLGQELNCDAVIQGQVNQSGTQHQVVYDAVVVSCSLQLVHCQTGKALWRCEQFRTAHRQFQFDPFNAFINLVGHEEANRADRIAWLVQEIFRTLPQGPIQVVTDNLLNQAIQIEVDIKEPMKKLEAKENEEVIQINLSSDILFDFDKYSIRDDAQEILINLIPIINKFRDAKILIVGHTDAIGDDEYNKKLSLKRAETCRDWIIQRIHTTNQQFTIEGMGEDKPLVANDTPDNRKKNRRVEITIKKKDLS